MSGGVGLGHTRGVVAIPPAALARDSALNDDRVDRAHGPAGTAYITDSAPHAEASIVLDLASGAAVRSLPDST